MGRWDGGATGEGEEVESLATEDARAAFIRPRAESGEGGKVAAGVWLTAALGVVVTQRAREAKVSDQL